MNEALESTNVDVVIVGAGFSGIYATHRLRTLGFSVLCVEAGGDVGGTWYWNRYPGARCDVESVDYSYAFSEELQQEFNWTERYAAQPEILRYLQHVATRFDLYRSMRFNTRVTAATFDGALGTWLVQTDASIAIRTRFLVLASGSLSVPLVPAIPGLDEFHGPVLQTSRWPHGRVELAGRRVAVIGTGSSGIQAIPVIAAQCERLYVFQRTPNFSVPARNRPYTAETLDEIKSHYRERRELANTSRGGTPFRYRPESAMDVDQKERLAVFESAWERGGTHFIYAFADLATNVLSNEEAVKFVHSKILERVADRQVAETLLPRDHPLGSKRICADSEYYETFNRSNVTLVDLRSTPLTRATRTGLQTTGGQFDIDVIVLATGFDALTGSFTAIDITGRDGRTIQQEWASGPRTFLGLMVAGFPNMFLMCGPGSPSVLTNMVNAAEQHADWIGDCLVHLRDHGRVTIEARPERQDEWVAHVNEVASQTLYPQANSWYLGANMPGKPRVFMPYIGGMDVYRAKCAEVASRSYADFDVR